MKYFIPTYNQAQEIVKENGELVFYETVKYINNFKISMFNYRITPYEKFINPVSGKKYNAKELRGLTYVFNKDNSLFNRYLMLNKFWNINQVEETQINLLINKKIKSVYNKVDGSLISFIKLPNNLIITKTKMGIDNEQTVAADKIINKNNKLKLFISDMINNDIIPFFEFTSFKNKVVLNYDKNNLTLLRLRNNNTGEYINIEKYRNLGFDVVEKEKFNNLEELLKLKETLTNKEGWTITFNDDYIIKLKTDWYFEKHQLNDSILFEHIIIKMILDETIDDVLSQLDKIYDKEKIIFINEIHNKVLKYIKIKKVEINNLYKKYNGDIKDFALKYKKDRNFSLAVNLIKGYNIYDIIKEYIYKNTNKLFKARDFLNKIK